MSLWYFAKHKSIIKQRLLFVSQSLNQKEKTMKKGTKRITIILIVLVVSLILSAAISLILYNNYEDSYDYSEPKKKQLEEVYKIMSLDCLSDRERELWYTVNESALAKYNLAVRERAAQQIYENQLFVEKFGEEEYSKTAGIPGSDIIRRQQLKNRLIEEAWIKAFGPKH